MSDPSNLVTPKKGFGNILSFYKSQAKAKKALKDKLALKKQTEEKKKKNSSKEREVKVNASSPIKDIRQFVRDKGYDHIPLSGAGRTKAAIWADIQEAVEAEQDQPVSNSDEDAHAPKKNKKNKKKKAKKVPKEEEEKDSSEGEKEDAPAPKKKKKKKNKKDKKTKKQHDGAE